MRRRSFIAAASVAVPSLAGCTGDSPGDDETPTESPTETRTDTPSDGDDGGTARDEYPDYDWALLDDAEPVGTDTVTLTESSFDPLIAAVAPGTTVKFENEDSFEHTVTMPKLDVDDELDGGASTTVEFAEAGTYDYVCTVHPPDMLGRIEVTEEPPTETPTETPTDTPTDTPSDGDGDGDDGDGGYY